MISDKQRHGVLVISAWIEPETDEFRARIMQTPDATTSDVSPRWASSRADVVAMVEDWLATVDS